MRGKAALIILACALLIGCGKRGSLERPPPLWGDPPAETTRTDAPDASEPDDEDDG